MRGASLLLLGKALSLYGHTWRRGPVGDRMRPANKIGGEARQDVAVVDAPLPPQRPVQRRRKVAVGLSLEAKREVLKQFVHPYRDAVGTHKRMLLDDVVRLTGYHRTYASWLLNQPVPETPPAVRPRHHSYGHDVEEVLLLVWNASNRVCAKRLVPCLPMFLDALERCTHLHLTPECRRQLLSISAATVDRLLRPHRHHEMRGLCTTRRGTLLKQNIPLRTFEQWDEQVPGFVEADLVAHCGSSVEGTYLFTLTLTDIATGWTECLPLLSKSAEAVLAAIQRARSLFPFPLLGLDTDNGTEFINDLLVSYCETEQITFTRGRPGLKNDQCYVEQKNGHVVRQVVGYYRFVGEPAFVCLDDLYRMLCQYVNVFQPSMKLCAKFKEGKKVRRVYDEAKTPLMRLLQAEVMPAEQERALMKQFEDLDFVRLLAQAKQAQQALFRHATGIVPQREKRRRLFASERFRVVGTSLVPSAADGLSWRELGTGRGEEEPSVPTSVLEWHRTCNDPFQEQWEVIAQWVRADPERSCRVMFEELRRLSPDRYQPSHLRTLQRGVRKIRARLLNMGVPSQKDVQNAEMASTLVSDEYETQQHDVHDGEVYISTRGEEHEENNDANEQGANTIIGSFAGMRAHNPSFEAQEVTTSVQEPLSENAPQKSSPAKKEQSLNASLVSDPSSEPNTFCKNPTSMTIEDAIGDYLVAQQQAKRRPKTMEWHQTALGLFGQYLRTECECVLLAEMTERHVHGWLESLRVPIARGMVRSANTRRSYARSARAWCQWLVNSGYLTRTPFARITLPKEEPPVMHPLETEEWERLLTACSSPAEGSTLPGWAPARNRALLWVLHDTGMRLSEVCALRLGDVDLEQGLLMVRRNGFKGRRLPLGHDALHTVRVYVEQHRVSGRRAGGEHAGGSDKPLFLSETGHALTENGIESLFGRLRERAGMTKEDIGPTLLRNSFVVRSLQAGEDVFRVRDLLGHRESAAVKRFLRKSDEGTKNDTRKEQSQGHRE